MANYSKLTFEQKVWIRSGAYKGREAIVVGKEKGLCWVKLNGATEPIQMHPHDLDTGLTAAEKRIYFSTFAASFLAKNAHPADDAYLAVMAFRQASGSSEDSAIMLKIVSTEALGP